MANKRIHISEIEEFYIRKNPDSLTESDISNKLNISLKKVREILEDEQTKITAGKESEQKKEPTPVMKILTPRPDISGKKKGYAIMQQSASEILDEANKNNRIRARKEQPSHITKTFPDRE